MKIFLEFISETEDEFITNLLDGEKEEIENFKKTLTHLKDNELKEKEYLEQFNKIKSDNLKKHSDVYEQILRQVTLTILIKIGIITFKELYQYQDVSQFKRLCWKRSS